MTGDECHIHAGRRRPIGLSTPPLNRHTIDALHGHVTPTSSHEGGMDSFHFCVPNPADPDHPICEEIPTLIEPPHQIPDPKNLLGEIPDSLRTDIAVLVAVDQLAAGLQDEQMRSCLVGAIDQAAEGISTRMSGQFALRRMR
jgi:hypothetical protein